MKKKLHLCKERLRSLSLNQLLQVVSGTNSNDPTYTSDTFARLSDDGASCNVR